MPETLLIVDDEDKILRSIERMLADSDLRVLTARNAEQALRLVRSEEVSVILSDNRMPGMGGIDLLSLARQKAPDSVRILMTGDADMATAIDAINKGEVFRFVTKPWDDAALERILHEAIERHRIVRGLKQADEASLLSIGQAIELKDPYTRGHCSRVAEYALLIAGSAGLPEEEQKRIKHGSWLHDCGKIGVPEAILSKEGPLTAEELETVEKHPAWGAEIARQARLSETIVNIVLYHHEHFDGGGYPCRLAGDDIPREARIVAAADVFDALTTDRPYRRGAAMEEAMETMNRHMRGSVLDPRILDLFALWVQRLTNEEADYANGSCGT